MCDVPDVRQDEQGMAIAFLLLYNVSDGRCSSEGMGNVSIWSNVEYVSNWLIYSVLYLIVNNYWNFFWKKSEKKFVSLEKGSTFASAIENAPYLIAQR